MRNLQPLGALFIIVGAIILYLLRGPLVSLILLVLEFVAIVVALVLIAVGIALLVGGSRIRRSFWMQT